MMKIPTNLGEILISLIGEQKPPISGCAVVPSGEFTIHESERIKVRIIRELDRFGIVRIERTAFGFHVTAGWKTWQHKKPKSPEEIEKYVLNMRHEMSRILDKKIDEVKITID